MDALAERLVTAIVGAVQPERVYLFGSRAQGHSQERSDVDLLVVHSGPETKREVLLKIRSLFHGPDFSMDLFVLTPEEFESQKGIANTLAREVAERGILCYARG